MTPNQATLQVDCNAWQGELPRIWTSIGYDEINWTYTPRGKALLRTLKDLAERPYVVRNHNFLTSGNGLSWPAWGATNVYHEMPDGSPHYHWAILDRVLDAYTGVGFRPLIELGFMPRDLAAVDAGASDWQRDLGVEGYESGGLWKHPPKDYAAWSELVYQFVRHCVERYGAAEVGRWYFEVWNEPDIPHYWLGSVDEYGALYDHAVAGAMRALPSVQIGGPASTSPASTMSPAQVESLLARTAAAPAGPEDSSTRYLRHMAGLYRAEQAAGRTGAGFSPARAFFDRFLDHCVRGTNAATGETGTRLDFISFHTKGAFYSRRRIYNPELPVERESPSSAIMVADIQAGLESIARHEALHGVPVFVDECDPAVGTIYGVFDNPNFVVTNNEHYPNFICALTRRILDLSAAYPNPVALMTSWAFYFEGKRFFEGNRTLVDNENIEKPVLNAFRMFSRLGHTRVQLSSDRRRDVAAPEAAASEVDGLAAVGGDRVTVLLWHQADEWWAEGEAEVSLRVEHLPFGGQATVRRYQIDGEHSNAYAEWVRQGCPQDPSPAQVARIKERQGLELYGPPAAAPIGPDGSLDLCLTLPMFATVLLEIEPLRS